MGNGWKTDKQNAFENLEKTDKQNAFETLCWLEKWTYLINKLRTPCKYMEAKADNC